MTDRISVSKASAFILSWTNQNFADLLVIQKGAAECGSMPPTWRNVGKRAVITRPRARKQVSFAVLIGGSICRSFMSIVRTER